MKENVIGDQRIFAIEYTVLIVNPSPPYGDCRLWLGGNVLGGLEGEVYLNRVCKCLEGVSSIKNQLFLEENLYNLSDTELFNLMEEQKIDEKGTYWFMDTEGFDLFRSYVYRRDETFHFLWQLAKVREEFELQGLTTQLFSVQIAISLYEEIIKKFRNLLMKLYKF